MLFKVCVVALNSSLPCSWSDLEQDVTQAPLTCGAPTTAALPLGSRCPREASWAPQGASWVPLVPVVRGLQRKQTEKASHNGEWQTYNILEVHRDVNSRGKNDTKRVHVQSTEEKSDSCAKTQWRETLWRPPLLVRTLWGQGSSAETAKTVLQFDSCQLQKQRNKCELTILLYVCTLWSWHLNIGAILPQCLDEKASSQLPTHMRLEHTVELLGTTHSV